jgi:NAD+ diphosphatase
MAIVSPDGESILLGRQKKWPNGFYSCLAGFLEPGESLEEAVRREILEESGVGVGRVTYHSSQPWPFPANLMMGAIGQAIEGKDKIRLDLDNELEDARFFTREEVLKVVESTSSNWHLSKKDLGKIDENVAAAETEKKLKEEQQPRGRGSLWDHKDSGSVANVTERGPMRSSPSPSPSRRPRRGGFKIPGPTAIAHVLISSWARGEANFSPPDSLRGKM